jgi:N-acetyl-gamma-glutamyl-phosphate reductase
MIPVGIVGFSGYSGAELVHILSRHPRAEPVLLEHRESQDRTRPINYQGPRRLAYSPNNGLALVFLATPPEISIELTPALLEAGTKVVDLSGAFRLGTVDNYRRWYKEAHPHASLLAEAAYGLPEFNRSQVAGKRLISNPGCYPTAANLALRPLVDAGVIDRSAGVVCDAKSGVSGAGRKPSLKTSFVEVTENFSAYSVLEHRHVPEILRTSGLEESELSFTAQLIPIDRGILETIYFRTKNVSSAVQLIDIYQAQYANEPFVRVYPAGTHPDLHAVTRTNFCDIGVHFDAKTGRAVVISAIDNLVKGAAGMAVQNMNLALGFPETAGLL